MSEAAPQTDPMNGSTAPDVFRTHDLIATLRRARAETLEDFGRRIAVNSKGRMSQIERGLITPTPEQALAIEELSEGAINASALNPIVAKARGVEWSGDHGPADTAKMEAVSTGNIQHLSGGAA